MKACGQLGLTSSICIHRTFAFMLSQHKESLCLHPAAAPPHAGASPCPSQLCWGSAGCRLSDQIRSDQGSEKPEGVFPPSKVCIHVICKFDDVFCKLLVVIQRWTFQLHAAFAALIISFSLLWLKWLIHNLILVDLPKSFLGEHVIRYYLKDNRGISKWEFYLCWLGTTTTAVVKAPVREESPSAGGFGCRHQSVVQSRAGQMDGRFCRSTCLSLPWSRVILRLCLHSCGFTLHCGQQNVTYRCPRPFESYWEMMGNAPSETLSLEYIDMHHVPKTCFNYTAAARDTGE